ncbi:MAG: helix-turn-helix domain-containing protein [Sandarakinorhabdus sp.]|jgi:hypothetical protein|nr:helix-turn-helix domain-containing protein [Sandarakinorhabdus sp.]
MSIALMTAVWSCDLPPTEKLVLMALADRANDDGQQCYPSIRELCRKSGASERTVQGCIKRLVEAGHLTRDERPGRGVNYIVHPRTSCAPAKAAPPQKTPKTPAESAPNTSGTTITEAKASGGEAPPVDDKPNLKTMVWDRGRQLLTAAGIPDAKARSMVGKWLKLFGDGAVFEALATAEREAAIDPIPFITATLERRHDNRASSHQAGQHGRRTDRPGTGPGEINPHLAAGLARLTRASPLGQPGGRDQRDPDEGSDPLPVQVRGSPRGIPV